jgi:hypothetical protein
MRETHGVAAQILVANKSLGIGPVKELYDKLTVLIET